MFIENTLQLGDINLEILLFGYGNNETVRNTLLCDVLSELIEQTERF